MNSKVRCDFSFDTLKLLAAFGIHQRHHDLEIGICLTQKLGRFQEIGTKHFDFCTTAARQQCQTVGIVRDTQHITGTIFIWI
ncbi:Uncharacterised protein [Klebsiella pneumoniae]|nr:Uncharacterised protein [Klebsiella pneumoniae]